MGDAGEDDVEPLEIVPYPVPIEAHDPEAGGASVVRLFFQPGDRAAAPDVDLADVVILETWDRVSIGLVRRGVTLDVALAEPLGPRPLVDAWTGEVVRRVQRGSDDPLHTETVGTPLWRR